MLKENLNSSVCYSINEKLNLKKYYVFILFIVILFLIILFIPFYEYKKYYLYVQNDEFKLLVDDDFFPVKKGGLYIDKKNYKYDVLSISSSSLVNNKKYYEVMIEIKIDKKILTTQNIIEVILKKEKISLIKKFIREIK